MLDIALSYQARGWAVFPCKGKFPLTKNGFHDASTVKNKIHRWFHNRDCDIAIATGAVSGIIVLDIDAKSGGLASLDQLKEEFGHDAFYTYTVKTGGGGYHYYFKHPGYHVNLRVGLRPGVDLRADGGYVIAPPSLHDSGTRYELVTDLDPIECPAKLLELIKPKESLASVATPITDERAQAILEGGRNNYLTKVAGRLQRAGLSTEALRCALHQENQDKCNPPLPDSEVEAMITWVQKYEAQDPVLNKATFDAETLMLRAGDIADASIKYIENRDLVMGQPTGLPGLDKLLGGGKRLGEITAWQAHAKTGKNTLWHALQYIHLKSGIPVAYASREMSPDTEVIPNLLSLHFQKNVLLSPVTPEDRIEYKKAIESWPLYFSKGYGYFPIEEIREWVKEGKRMGITHFWFDHLHYMILEPEEHKDASKLMKVLKTLAKEENIHIDIITQPNKTMEDNQKLGLNSMKGGSAIGQAIDNMIVLDRMKGEGIEKNVMRLELQVGRSSLCRPGEIYLKYNPETRDFTEIDVLTTKIKPTTKQWTRPGPVAPSNGATGPSEVALRLPTLDN